MSADDTLAILVMPPFAGFTPPGNEMTRVLASADPHSYIEVFASVNGEPAFVSMMQMSYAFAVGMRHAAAAWPRLRRVWCVDCLALVNRPHRHCPERGSLHHVASECDMGEP